MSVRLGTGLISITIANTTTLLWTKSLGKTAIIRKLFWINRTAGAGYLRIGYTTLAAAWTQVSPDIWMVSLADGQLMGTELPIFGNYREGFQTDTTAVTGTLGHIQLRSTVAGVAPNDIQVYAEIEEY